MRGLGGPGPGAGTPARMTIRRGPAAGGAVPAGTRTKWMFITLAACVVSGCLRWGLTQHIPCHARSHTLVPALRLPLAAFQRLQKTTMVITSHAIQRRTRSTAPYCADERSVLACCIRLQLKLLTFELNFAHLGCMILTVVCTHRSTCAFAFLFSVHGHSFWWP